jgi:membrane-associated phospholipid phosphatase
MEGFLANILKNIRQIFSIKNLVWHIIAILLTYVIVKSGIDWYYFQAVRGETLNKIFFPAVVIGGLLPTLLPIGLILTGFKNKHEEYMTVGIALAEATIIGSLISSSYKALTGRIQPNVYDTVDNISNGFQFGFWEHGIFWGWPSSHTTIAFAMAFTLVMLFTGNKKIKYISIFYAFYIGVGVSLAVHWFSDFVAGAILGTLIGIIVGKNFRQIKF